MIMHHTFRRRDVTYLGTILFASTSYASSIVELHIVLHFVARSHAMETREMSVIMETRTVSCGSEDESSR